MIKSQTKRFQSGAATLLVALVLMMSITVITLAVARTQVAEQRITANDNWNIRLSLQAEASLAQGIAYLNRSFEALTWTAEPEDDSLISRLSFPGNWPDIKTELVIRRPAGPGEYISLHAISQRNDNSNVLANAQQHVRPLSVLTPWIEFAPPLVINGCPTGVPGNVHIRPLNTDSDQAGEAIWLNEDASCPAVHSIDIHGGSVTQKPMVENLWPLIFSVSLEAFDSLALDERDLPANKRRYWVAQASDLYSDRWGMSLGTTKEPVVLYFPSELGCPEFTGGVRIYGVIFIDTDCPDPVNRQNFEIFGTLIVNGSLNITDADIQFNHIQVEDSRKSRLHFPILRSVRVPGSWKDF